MRSAVASLPGLHLVEHELEVPLDHARPGGETITVFAREVADPDGRDRPLLVFLQGGPGFEAPRPVAPPVGPGWLGRALEEFRVLLVDQRGTGRSTPVGTLEGLDPDGQAERLAHFRADAIVRDCEALREALGVERWSVLGQSFGGLCVMTYLSIAPHGLREALVTGGLGPLGPGRIDDVYALTAPLVAERWERHLARFPGDADRFARLMERAEAGDLALPGGDVLTPTRLRTVGSLLGMSDGSAELHALLELPPDSPAFRHDVAAVGGFDRNPIYAVLHEACWADGGATRWAAERVLPDDLAVHGEHVLPATFDDHGALRPLREAAHRLAGREWPRLCDEAALAACEVPVAAAVYVHDMYVPRVLSEETAAAIRGCRTWVTSEFEHNGLRADGRRVLGHLLDLVRDRR